MTPRTWFALAGAAASAYGLTAVLARRARALDEEARLRTRPLASKPVERLSRVTGHIGKWYTHVPLALAGSAALAARGRREAAVAVSVSSLAATGLSHLLEAIEDRRAHRVPPPGKTREEPAAQSFPSNHAIETTAVALAAGVVLVREQLAPVAVVAPLGALAALVSGLGRLMLDRHWTSDLVGGYAAGIALGAACAGGYEAVRRSEMLG